ncbi:putative oxido YgbJ [Cyphellophora attinorum]|uniref:Putative oxido YgbJ n=1 Tax=Cyphellophora attinorum TaxID=1664694 RepID=A0A0N0NIM5_9EURO|nr:putative oxido YgbJ [Phialophora attinorum]KPI35619.1 putative oxido YgbJ [Phialophora attinorum]
MSPMKVSVAGLGAIGYGMAISLIRAGFDVTSYDINEAVLERFKATGRRTASSIRALADGAGTFICVVATAEQALRVIFDKTSGALSTLPHGSTIILAITARPDFVSGLQEQIEGFGRDDVTIIDCPVSGGEARANSGTLSLMYSGKNEAVLSKSESVLRAIGTNLYEIPGGLGAASQVKFVHQIFVGVNIVAAVEMSALARSAGMNIRQVHASVMHGEAASWLFDQRVSHLLDAKSVPASSLRIITKDMGMISAYCREHRIGLPTAMMADQLLKTAAFRAWDLGDDTSVINLYGSATDYGRIEKAQLSPEDIGILLLGIHTAASIEVLRFAQHFKIDEALLLSVVKEAAGANKAFDAVVRRFPLNAAKEQRFAGEQLQALQAQMVTILGRVSEHNFPQPLCSVACQVVQLAGDGLHC